MISILCANAQHKPPHLTSAHCDDVEGSSPIDIRWQCEIQDERGLNLSPFNLPQRKSCHVLVFPPSQVLPTLTDAIDILKQRGAKEKEWSLLYHPLSRKLFSNFNTVLEVLYNGDENDDKNKNYNNNNFNNATMPSMEQHKCDFISYFISHYLSYYRTLFILNPMSNPPSSVTLQTLSLFPHSPSRPAARHFLYSLIFLLSISVSTSPSLSLSLTH
jgi:hypothetical protein